jgi:hypothetical protein
VVSYNRATTLGVERVNRVWADSRLVTSPIEKGELFPSIVGRPVNVGIPHLAYKGNITPDQPDQLDLARKEGSCRLRILLPRSHKIIEVQSSVLMGRVVLLFKAGGKVLGKSLYMAAARKEVKSVCVYLWKLAEGPTRLRFPSLTIV